MSILVYDHQFTMPCYYVFGSQHLITVDRTTCPLPWGIPAHLLRLQALQSKWKLHRRHKNHSGPPVRMKACLAFFMTYLAEYRMETRLLISRQLLDPFHAWMVPGVGLNEVFQPRTSSSPHSLPAQSVLTRLAAFVSGFLEHHQCIHTNSCKLWPGKYLCQTKLLS